MAKNVNVGQITSSPGPMPIAISEQSRASVPLLTPIACFVWQYAARFFSNFSTCGPKDQGLRVANFIDGAADFIADGKILRLQIQEFHVHDRIQITAGTGPTLNVAAMSAFNAIGYKTSDP